jgi:hypothetical protein
VAVEAARACDEAWDLPTVRGAASILGLIRADIDEGEQTEERCRRLIYFGGGYSRLRANDDPGITS